MNRTDRDYHDGCLLEQRAKQAAAFAQAEPEVLAALRANSNDPAHGGTAGRKRGERNAAHVAALVDWKREHTRNDPSDLDTFSRAIFPRLRGVPLRAIAEATGLSEGYCSFVRRGQKVPHRRHWAALQALAEGRSGAVS